MNDVLMRTAAVKLAESHIPKFVHHSAGTKMDELSKRLLFVVTAAASVNKLRYDNAFVVTFVYFTRLWACSIT